MTVSTTPAAPPEPRVRRGRSLRGPLVTLGAVGVACVGLALRDPHRAGSYGWCPLQSTTGLYCPLCGGLRGTWDLLHGDVAGAWSMNPLWVVATPLVMVVWALWFQRSASGRTMPSWLASTRAAIVLAAVLLAFGVLRNLPALETFLAPR